MRPSGRRWQWTLPLVSLLLAGCMFGDLSQNLALIIQVTVLRGTVRPDHPRDLPILVVIYSGEKDHEELVDYFVLAGPGPYFFFVPAGTYRLAAFEDVNRDFAYTPGVEPSALLRGGTPIMAESGATVEGLDIEILGAGRERVPFVFRSSLPEESGERSLAEFHLGEVTSLDDPRFSEDNARR